MYEKSEEKNINFEYSYTNEIKKIKKIYKNDNIRYAITRMLKNMRIYNFFFPLRKSILKILNLKS